MKGTVYTGIIHLPRHPHADLHGQLRCIVRTEGMTNLTSVLRLYDISFSPILFNYGIWCESKSQAELVASEKHYGIALVCPTWCQYLEAQHYQPIPEDLKRQQLPVSTLPGRIWEIGPHLFRKWDGFAGPRRECQLCRNAKSDPIHTGTVAE